jgi:hypothetical protein
MDARTAAERIRNPYWFLPRLTIAHRDGALLPMGAMEPEQLEVVAALQSPVPNTLVLKARKIGITTICVGWQFHQLLVAPERRGVLSVTHEEESQATVNNMLRVMANGLPRGLRPRLAIDNQDHLQLGNGSEFKQIVAGGRSQGRSMTFQYDHWTEMAFYPEGSAAIRGSAVDRAVWASVKSTVHKAPFSRTIVESTANGPKGRFYELCQVARRSKEWNFLFFPWFRTYRYTRELPDGWEMTDDEAEMLAMYGEKGLTERHLAWRRYKMEDEDLSLPLFRKEFPSTADEPFLVTGGMWFDAEMVNRMIALGRPDLCPETRDLVKMLPYHQGRRYFIGVDTSGGVGRDWAVIQVIRDDLVQCAVWRSNTTKPRGQAEQAAKLSTAYGRAPVLCEANRHGRTVISHMERDGVLLWKDDDGKDFWTQMGKAGNTKYMVMDHAADLVKQGYFVPSGGGTLVYDPTTLSELADLQEHENGNIAASGDGHDDHAMAWCLALWCGRRYLRGKPNANRLRETHEARMRRVRDPMGDRK